MFQNPASPRRRLPKEHETEIKKFGFQSISVSRNRIAKQLPPFFTLDRKLKKNLFSPPKLVSNSHKISLFFLHIYKHDAANRKLQNFCVTKNIGRWEERENVKLAGVEKSWQRKTEKRFTFDNSTMGKKIENHAQTMISTWLNFMLPCVSLKALKAN